MTILGIFNNIKRQGVKEWMREWVKIALTVRVCPCVSCHCVSDINQTVRIVLYSLIFLLSVLGNGLIITVLVRNRRMRTVTNLFLLSLSVSDLMVSLVCIPFTLIPNLMRDFIFGNGMCKLVMYFMGEWNADARFSLFGRVVFFELWHNFIIVYSWS